MNFNNSNKKLAIVKSAKFSSLVSNRKVASPEDEDEHRAASNWTSRGDSRCVKLCIHTAYIGQLIILSVN